MKSKPKIYLADLRHASGGLLSNPVMPLGIGYMRAVMEMELPEVDCRTFAYPDQLLETMKRDTPDILMLTNYVWNEQLSRYFTKAMKDLRPESLVVVGGPNIPVESERQISFFGNWTGLDVYALGEGDYLATEIVKRFLDNGMSIERLAESGIPSSIFRLSGQVGCEPVWKKELSLEKFPSPWLSGVQDQFFDGKLIPLVETNRGCPFKCTFCVQGDSFYNRVNHFDVDQVKEELTYIALRIKEVCPEMEALTIADPNYGMYKRDLGISAHIGSLQEKYSWPSVVDCSTGKNAPELVVKSLEQTNGALQMLHAVQSMEDEVLKSIKRSNIKVETYEKVTQYLNGKGVRTYSQTILCLPHETLQSHLAGLRKLVDSNEIDNIQNFQLMLLNGSEMETKASRDKFGFQTKFRVSPRCFGIYDSQIVVDMEEIVISTKTFPYDDYLHARTHHLAYLIFWGQGWFDDLFGFARNMGVNNSLCIEAIVQAMNDDEGIVRSFVRDFNAETQGELFSTPEECLRFYSEPERFEKLLRGDIGDNLLNKYRAMASFILWPEICQFAMRILKKTIMAHAPDKLDSGLDQFWEDLGCFVELKHASGKLLEDIIAPISCRLQYNLPAWIADGYAKEISCYKLEQPEFFNFMLSDSGVREIQNAIGIWSTDIAGLTKVARYLKETSQERQCLPSEDILECKSH